MAIVGWEMIAVVAVLAVILLWGPGKIPELAKSIGKAKRELEKTQKELTTFPSEETTSAPAPATPAPDDALISAARKLGISTEGKTRDAISREIVEKATANTTAKGATSSPK